MTAAGALDAAGSGGGPVLMEGAVVERLRRGSPQFLHPLLMNAPLVETPEGRSVLSKIYAEYMEIALTHRLPLLSLTPTWRANAERVAGSHHALDDLNAGGARLLQALRAPFLARGARIAVGGLMGCRGDAYRPEEALTRREAAAFHAPQAEALAAAGVDFLIASTLPNAEEAAGLADAFAATGAPYVLSFIIRRAGDLLDGTPLDEVVRRVDRDASHKPFGYLVNCVHSSVMASALEAPPGRRALATGRMLGLQANTSSKSPEELDTSEALEEEAPEDFAAGMSALRGRFGLRFLGGCCGTDGRHIAALAGALASEAIP